MKSKIGNPIKEDNKYSKCFVKIVGEKKLNIQCLDKSNNPLSVHANPGCVKKRPTPHHTRPRSTIYQARVCWHI